MELSPKVQRALTLGLTLGAGGLALSGCGSNEKEAITTADIEYPPVSTPTPSNHSPIKNVRYFDDGSRTFKIPGWGWSSQGVDAKEFCEGQDLITVSIQFRSGNLDRSPNHPACQDDGQITKSDFPQ